MQVENSFHFMCDNNTETLLDGRTFGDVVKYFFLGGDNACCIVSGGHVHVVWDTEKRKVPSITPLFA